MIAASPAATVHYRCIVWLCSAWVPYGRRACPGHRHVIPEGKETMMPCSRPRRSGVASVLLGSDTREEAARGCLCSDCTADAYLRKAV